MFFLDYGGPACFRCHGGFNFSDATEGSKVEFHNTELYNLAGPLSYPTSNTGLCGYTKRAADVGKFKAPTLRNIALTAPYMHDGSVRTLEDGVDHYSAGAAPSRADHLRASGAMTQRKTKWFTDSS